MNAQLLIALLVGFGVVGVACAIIFSALRIKREIPEEDRLYLDPLPKLLRLVWPLVRFIDYYLCRYIPETWTRGGTETLRLSGLLYLMKGSQFMALSILSMVLFVGIGAVALSMIELVEPLYLLILAAFGFYYPKLWLRDVLKKRRKLIVRALPSYLDFLTMGIEAGLNMNGAIAQAVDKGPSGPLRSEFALVLRDLRSGLTRSDALRRMDERNRIPQISNFVTAVVQADRMGSSLGATFRHQAEQRRTERFQLAEKLAMEAPVKLIFPLLVFIFPATFVILMFPIAVMFLNSGISL